MTITFQGPRTPCTPTFANEKVLQNDCEDPKKDTNIYEINCYNLHVDDDVHDANNLCCDVDYFHYRVNY